VIGETSEIGKNVTCTRRDAGGHQLEQGEAAPDARGQRDRGCGRGDPGPIRIGHDSKIGSGSVVNKECAQLHRRRDPRACRLPRGERLQDPTVWRTPDPEGKAIKCLTEQILSLEKKVEELTKRLEEGRRPRWRGPEREDHHRDGTP